MTEDSAKAKQTAKLTTPTGLGENARKDISESPERRPMTPWPSMRQWKPRARVAGSRPVTLRFVPARVLAYPKGSFDRATATSSALLLDPGSPDRARRRFGAGTQRLLPRRVGFRILAHIAQSDPLTALWPLDRTPLGNGTGFHWHRRQCARVRIHFHQCADCRFG